MRALLIALLLPTAAAAADCAPDLAAGGRTIAGDGYTLVMRPAPAPIPLGRHFAIDLAVCPQAGAAPALTRVEARMPEHGHGMNYRTTIVPRGEGRWRANGLLFHMPGRWELIFDLRDGGRSARLAVEEMVE